MNAKAQKLLTLALDPAAHTGEWENAARMFVGILRRDGETLATLLPAPAPAPRRWTATKMPFGRHKGLTLDEIPDDYLEWLVTCDLKPALRAAVRRELDRRAEE